MEELTLELSLGAHRSHRMGKDRKRALEESWEDGLHHGETRRVVLPRPEAASESAPAVLKKVQYPIFSWENMA